MGMVASAIESDSPQEASDFLSVVIQHHPARKNLLEPLLQSMGDLVKNAQIVEDSNWDSPKWDSWHTYRACLEAAPSTASHVLVLQDDVELCRDFADGVRAVIAARPERIICLYVGGGIIGAPLLRAGERCSHWTVLPQHLWLPAVATIYPRFILEELLTWTLTDKYALRARVDDAVLGRFLRTSGHRAWATVPCLVQHPDKVPSLIRRTAAGGRDRNRVAACYIGTHSPLDIEW